MKPLQQWIAEGDMGEAASSLVNQPEDLRPSGIEVIGAVPWGTHFCQFYATSQDLAEVLAPYFKAGLEANEYCMWVTSMPLGVEEAKAALCAILPDLEAYLVNGQMEIMDYSQWYTLGGSFDTERVLKGWSDRLAAARQRGFEGLRLTGNTFWLEAADWNDFQHYEERINEVIGGQRMIALCTYSLEKCGVPEILDVVANHKFALIKSHGKWEIIESPEHKKVEHALRESEERYRNLFTSMTEGFALHEIICDKEGKPVDYRFLEVNPAFEEITGLKRERVLGRTVLEALPDTETYWIDTYGNVALTGNPVHFENYSQAIEKYFEVIAFQPKPGQFAALFVDITQRKQLQAEAQKRATELEVHHRLMEQREQERLQIARDLHDGPVQELTAASFTLQGMILDCPDPQTQAGLEAVRRSVQDQVSELRAYAAELRPPTISKFGLEKAIQSYLDTFLEENHNIVVKFDARQNGKLLPENMRLALFRVCQHALKNTLKHAKATNVWIRLVNQNGRVELEIRDDGVGCSLPGDWLELARQGHLGLVGMRERVEAVGGTLEILSKPGEGTRVIANVRLGVE